ncbi:GMC family oxidoreductase [Gelidibacter gilvus]|uniref:GMC family oxidoreductase n=1 Tax=Gelidibacter gilvus TaxID=59602 RepID=A0A4V1LMF4_9FLAO|nr:GMC family oxidoreductase [Gelidibacter gilvus]RXJ44369.1 GMC family oxidoreductase [Gelidibacter gilvus]
MQEYSNKDSVDAVIIGTGAGGAPIIARLAEAGLKVVALEAGKFWNPKKDFATDEREQNKIIWNYERLSAGDDPIPFGKNNSGFGVGGSTLAYTAYTPRPHPDDFTINTDFGVGKDWPISYEDLEPYFDELESFLGVSGPTPYPWGPDRNVGYPLPPNPINGAAQLMEIGCEPLNIKTVPAANAILSAPYHQEHVGEREACINRGFCQAGCSTGAKASTDVTFIPQAIHFGAEIRTECFVTRLNTNESGQISSVTYLKNGQEETQFCKTVFICAGAIETPRLLLMNQLANSSGQVGKNFMANVSTQIWGEFEELVHPYKGIPASLISEDLHRPKDADFASGYLLQSIGVMPITYASQLCRATGMWGKELREKMAAYNHVAGINIHGECLPYEHNYVELSDENDELGLPKPRIFFSNGTNEKRLAAHGEKIMEKIWDIAGAKNTFKVSRNAHIIGTCRMGDDATEAVVNAQGKSFDIPNLYISDNSLFPSSLTVNPTLTIMAVALRIADKFLQEYSTSKN